MTGVGKMRQLLLVFSHLYSWWPEVKTSIFCFTLLLLRWPELEKSDTWFCLKTFTMNGTGKNGNLYVSTLSNSWSSSSNKSQGSNGAIKSDTGQHSQFLRCLISRHKGRRPCLGLTCITDTPHPLHRLRTPAPPIKEREKEYDSLPPVINQHSWYHRVEISSVKDIYSTSIHNFISYHHCNNVILAAPARNGRISIPKFVTVSNISPNSCCKIILDAHPLSIQAPLMILQVILLTVIANKIRASTQAKADILFTNSIYVYKHS